MKLRFLLLLLAFPCLGAFPPLDWIFPPALGPGTNEITFGGKFAKWPPGIWCSDPSLVFITGTNTGKVSVVVSEEIKSGPKLLRLYNEEDSSEPKALLVTNIAITMEVETNDLMESPQIITDLPTVVAGRLEKNNDIDFYQASAREGQWIQLKLDGYSLGSPMDPLLHVYDSNGLRVAFNHDSAQSIDPAITFRVPADGPYTIQIVAFENPPSVNVRFAGGSASIYLLHVTVTEEPPPPPPYLAEASEIEPNNSRTNAQQVSLPANFISLLHTNSDVDVFTFKADAKKDLEIEAKATSLGSPLDLHLRLLNNDGQEVSKDDDDGNLSDPRIEFTPGATNTFFLFVTDLLHQANSNAFYQLIIGPATPRFDAFAPASKFVWEKGKTNEIKVELPRRASHKAELTATIEPLLEGLVLQTNSSTSKDITLKVEVPESAPLTNGPFKILIHDKAAGITRPALFRFRTEESKGDFLVNETAELWFTIPETKTPDAKKE